jgi:glycosyltransferase involved in cell wall biosynthesis
MLACAGLDHALRGFESFARECFDVLRDDPRLDLELVKGSGPPGPRERSVPTLKRDSPLALALGRASGREPFYFEHFEFAFSLLPLILKRDPDLIYLSEWHTARGLDLIRRATGRRFKMLLNNGTMSVSGFEHLDHVQQLTPVALETVLAYGDKPGRHSMLPLGFDISPDFEPVGNDERDALRRRLDLPSERRTLVSVAALNRYHKRLDYFIEEVARLPEPRPYVLLLGQVEPETEGIRTLARERLGEHGHSIRTVPQSEVRDLSRASDAFVLASLGEGLPRALIEGLAAGLPCLAHDYGVTRFALGENGRFADFSEPGGLAALLSSSDGERNPELARARHRYAYDKFGWHSLRPRYVDLLRRVSQADSA